MSTRRLACATACCLAILALLPASERGAWPGWRGPDGNGVAPSDTALIDSLPEQPPLVWRMETLEGKPETHSSPAIANGRVYLHTAAEVEKVIDGKKKGTTNAALIAYHLADGKELWRHDYDRNRHATPCTAGDRVIVQAGNGMLYCYNGADGSTVWESRIHKKNGSNSSPVVVGDVIVAVVGRDLIGVGLADGQELWKTKKVTIWNNSPVVWKHQGKHHVLTDGKRVLNCGSTIGCWNLAK